MDGDVQETNLDEVEVDEDGNLRRSRPELYEEDDVHEPLNLEDDEKCGASGWEALSPKEKQALRNRQAQKEDYSREGTAEESIGMMAMDSGKRDAVSDSSGSYLGLSDDYPELAASTAAQTFQVPPPRYEEVVRWQQEEPGRALHEIELSVIEPAHTEGASENVDSAERGEQASGSKRREWNLSGLLDLVVTLFTKSSPEKLAIFFAAVAVVVGVLLLVGLLPASFVYIEYYELALAKHRVSGRVNRDVTYYPGCYLLTPDIELIRFQGTVHTIDTTVEIVTSDQLAFNLDFSLQYSIKPDELGLLHREYEHNYTDVVMAMVISTTKNEGVKFSLDNYRLNRSLVENDFKDVLAYRLGGDCCPFCCPKHCGPEINCFTCRLLGRCLSRGIHMKLKHFQMGAIDIPNDVAERFLRQTVLKIEAEKEEYIQEHAVQMKLSELERQKILHQAAEIRENATSAAAKIGVISKAEYEKQVQGSYIDAMRKFYQRLNVTQEEHKLSLMYIRGLEDIADNLYNLNYEEYTSFGNP